MKKLSDAQIGERANALRAEVQGRLEGVERDDPNYKQKLREAVEPAMVPGLCPRARSGTPHAGDAAFRRAAHRRICAASRQNRRDEDGRRKNARRHAYPPI